MEIKISPAKENSFPLGGFLIQKPLVKEWILELQNLGINVMETSIFPIPGSKANTIWGCFVLMHKPIDSDAVGRNQLCQRVCEKFYIPEKSKLSPQISEEDEKKLFSKSIHIFHPEFKLVELLEELKIEDLLEPPIEKSKFVIKPAQAPFIPHQIIRFQVMPVEEESALEKLEKEIFPKQGKLPDEPLTAKEKGKLAFYKKIFKRVDGEKETDPKNIEKTSFGEHFGKFLGLFSKKEGVITDRMQQDFEDLEKRNQNELDRLMEMFKDNPDEALKYAIPLDENGSTRGTNNGSIGLSKRWSNFSLGQAGLGGGGGGSVDLGDGFNQLKIQYLKSAEAYCKQGEYEKAAFVYMKLLKNFRKAAETLKSGGLYEAAAEIYLKHCNEKMLAAECYVKGNMFNKAIELYEEQREYLKVADLYMKLKKQKKAFQFYEKTVEEYKSKRKYLLAADIYRLSMNDDKKAQRVLMEGWESGNEASDCLNQYFHHVKNDTDRLQEIENVFAYKVNDKNRELFLKVIQKEYRKNKPTQAQVRELGYKIIAQQAKLNPRIVEELKVFNPKDQEINKDTSRFRWDKPSR